MRDTIDVALLIAGFTMCAMFVVFVLCLIGALLYDRIYKLREHYLCLNCIHAYLTDRWRRSYTYVNYGPAATCCICGTKADNVRSFSPPAHAYVLPCTWNIRWKGRRIATRHIQHDD